MNSHERITSAILGMYIGDALAMPVHWYYDREALRRDYGWVTDYKQPKNPHPNSILWRSKYTPLNEKGNILHEQEQFWGEIGIHYHQFLTPGENTLNLKLCSLLIESLNRKGGYDADDYLKAYIHFMQTPGNHRDTYIEEYHRHFFRNYASGKRPRFCGAPETHISGIIGMIPIVAFYAEDPESAAVAAMEHLSLTHLGPQMETAGKFLLDILLALLAGESLEEHLKDIEQQDHSLIKIPLSSWRYKPDEDVIGKYIGSACYVPDALPAIAYLALKYNHDMEQCLIANTNLGGDNAGRGAILGAILGAANGRATIPIRWINGLVDPPPTLKKPQY